MRDLRPNLGFGRRGDPPAYLDHLLFQAGGTDWASFNQQVGSPSFVGGFAVLDGVDDYLAADFTQDYDGCSIWAVVEVTATNSAQDTIIQINPGTTAIVSVEAGTIGEYRATTRMPAGYGTTLMTPTNPAGGVKNAMNEVILVGMVFETDDTIRTIHGHYAAEKTSRPASVAMTRLVVGQKNLGFYTGMRAGEVVVLDTTDPAVIDSYLKVAQSTYGLADIPWVTPLAAGSIMIVGDSIGAGVGASSATTQWSYLTALDFVSDRTSYAVADSQISVLGLVGAAKIDASFARAMTAGALANRDAVVVFAGSNDWGGAAGIVPISTYGDTSENTFYGALWDGFEDFLLNAPAGITCYLCTTVNTNTGVTNTLGNTILDYDAAIRNFVATKNHARLKLIDTRLAGLTNPADFADGIHPNNSGHAKLAAYITRSIGANYGIVR